MYCIHVFTVSGNYTLCVTVLLHAAVYFEIIILECTCRKYPPRCGSWMFIVQSIKLGLISESLVGAQHIQTSHKIRCRKLRLSNPRPTRGKWFPDTCKGSESGSIKKMDPEIGSTLDIFGFIWFVSQTIYINLHFFSIVWIIVQHLEFFSCHQVSMSSRLMSMISWAEAQHVGCLKNVRLHATLHSFLNGYIKY